MTRVFNPHTVEQVTEYLERHFNALERVIQAVQDTETSEAYSRKKGIVPLDGTGAGVAQLAVPLGFDYILQRVTATGGAGGTLGLYENVQVNSELLEQIPLGAAGLYSDAFNNNIYVPSGSTLLIAFAGAGANGNATWNLQIKLVKRKSHTESPVNTYIGAA